MNTIDKEYLVKREVLANQTMMIEENFKKDVFSYDDIDNMYYLACSSCGDVAENIEPDDDDNDLKCSHCGYLGEEEPGAMTAKDIYEWWLVTDWLAGKLEDKGEPMLSNEYGTWWGRTTTGQAISMDWVIGEIYYDLLACEKCGIIHDVDDERKATGSDHDIIQANKVMRCECLEHPDDEFCEQFLDEGKEVKE